MFTAALFTVAKTWNQPKCSSMIDWTGKMWHIYIMEYYAAIKNEEFHVLCRDMDKPGSHYSQHRNRESKLTQEQRIKHHMFSLIGGC